MEPRLTPGPDGDGWRPTVRPRPCFGKCDGPQLTVPLLCRPDRAVGKGTVHEKAPEDAMVGQSRVGVRECPAPRWVLMEREREQLGDSLGFRLGHLPDAWLRVLRGPAIGRHHDVPLTPRGPCR